MLQQRLASGSQASCSYVSRPLASSRAHHSNAGARMKQKGMDRSRCRHLCRVAEMDETEEVELQELPNTPYERIVDINNIYPDYDDPDWVERVSNWDEFWHEDDDILGIEDQDPNSFEAGGEKLTRAYQLAEQLADLRKRADVEQMVTNSIRPTQYYDMNYTSEEEYRDSMAMVRIDPNPPMSLADARALAEKRRAKAMFDAEWERQCTLLARPYSFTLRVLESEDVRLQGAEWDIIREDWTDEQIQDLILGGGKFVHPSKVPMRILNPLIPVDYVEQGARAIPETEEFLEEIGHLATEDEIMHLQDKTITLEERDFVDPGLVFEDNDGMVYQEAPINRWAELQKYRDQADLEMFEKVVDKVTARQEKAEARRAAKEAALAGEEGLAMPAEEQAADDFEEEEGEDEEGEEHWLDEIMGQGFTEFIEDDEGEDADVVYVDYEEGDEVAEFEEGERYIEVP